uniref:R-spondin 3 n=1 Tax=Seriola lalandi dorsalis TaxID=1841481 RepID=A0A3B4YS45_SERLL
MHNEPNQLLLFFEVCVLTLWCFAYFSGQHKMCHLKRKLVVSRLCPAGCASCSALNGCLSCKPRLFFHLELDGIRQRGTCLSSCPQGHYGMRSPQVNTCTSRYQRTHIGDCAFCFSDNFCTRCHQGHFLLRGKCDNSCPNGLTLMQCIPQVHCEVGEWTEWGPCIRKRRMQAYRRGEETRTRQVLDIKHQKLRLRASVSFLLYTNLFQQTT